MHTTRTPEVTFHHNGDYSGLILFTAPPVAGTGTLAVACPFGVLAAAAVVHRDDPDDAPAVLAVLTKNDATGPAVEVSVPVGAVRRVVGDRVASERICTLEQADSAALCQLAMDHEIARWATDTTRR